jgi:signal transduction histidine kinase
MIQLLRLQIQRTGRYHSAPTAAPRRHCEAGQLVLELSDYSVQDIAQTVRSTLEPLAADKKLAFKVEMAPQLPSGRGDGRRLTQVLINLVGNAIKFTDAGEVAIKAEANNGSFYVSVRDTGPGISAADQAKLFQEFQQADNAITKKKGGTGLGLAISKHIIEMHGGRIWVDSMVGKGRHLTLRLTADSFPRLLSISYSMLCPSRSVCSPARSTAEMWTNTSLPPLPPEG